MHKKLSGLLRVSRTLLCFAIAGALMTGCSSLESKSKTVTKTNGQYDVSTAKVEKNDMTITINGSGQFQTAKSTSLFYTDITGPLKKLYIKQNDEVKAGQTISEIDPESILKNIKMQELTMQKWTLQNQQMKENLLLSGKSVQQAKLRLDYIKKLYAAKPNEENKLSLDVTQIDYEQALSQDRSMKLSSKIAALTYKQDQLDLAQMKEKVAHSKLVSPVSGIAVFVDSISETEMVTSGRVIARIAEPKNIVFLMVTPDAQYINGSESATLKIGDEKYDVKFYTPQPGDLLIQSDKTVSERNSVYLTFTGKIPQIELGTVIDASLEIRKNNVLMIPGEALNELNGKTTADVMSGNNINTVNVIRGFEQDGMVEIVSGLKEGSSVVIQ